MFGRTDAAPAGDGLDVPARRRLDRFAALFDEIPMQALTIYEGPAEPDERLGRAMEAALFALGTPSRRGAAKDVVGQFVDAAERRYSDTFNVPELLGMGLSRPRADDRVRIFKALERAVVALIVWDQLDDDTRSALAGPWGELVERAVSDG